MSDGEGGFHLFDKGKNAYIKIHGLEPDTGQYQGNEYQQFQMVFDAVSETDSEDVGRIPFYPSSKITIQDTAEHTSDLGKLLRAAGILEDVLSELLESEEDVEAVVEGDARYVAENHEENVELGQAIAQHLKDKVLVAGTKLNNENDPDYSLVKDPHRLADSDPFSGGDGSAASSSEGTSEDNSEDDSGDEGGDGDVIFGDDEGDNQ
ncbi:hypothetical protein SAMN05443574_12439 [Haloarcula vallismortis]|uniref:Uncharacterized protein n=1 Tax=Haloarcula vallismortis TaxID=28442 RepID=A0A1H3AFC4_HALVA|nr:hypothetical protein [Haloarcula vallismortis]SDX28402.1 hypothetical protein SAMN05443574_12439 [Haloarcula vallismortis]